MVRPVAGSQVDKVLGAEEFAEIRRIVYESIGVNLTEAKKALVVSRLSRRLQELGLLSFAEYLRYLANTPREVENFFNCITTNVTNFFREEHHFTFLQNVFLPAVESRAEQKGRRILAWSAGCSTGEEPYTLAMVLEAYFKNKRGWSIKILASDINTEALEKARRGIYTAQEIRDVPYDLLKSHFKLGSGPHKGLFKVKENLQKMIEFRQVNLTSQDGYGLREPLDFIFCRNVFIYFNRQTRADVLRRFHQHLQPDGHLFLGHSESINPADEHNGRWKSVRHTIYKKLL